MKHESTIEISVMPAVVKLVPEDRFFSRIAGLHELIARRAYRLFEEAGFRHGHDLEDWFLAESQIQMPVPLEVSQSEDAIKVTAELPGFDAKDIEIHVQPQRLFVNGERLEESGSRKADTAHSEQLLLRVFRNIELPAEIDPDKVTATLKNGELLINLPKVKAEPAKAEPIAEARKAAA
jgi:HSP20 family protein